MSTGIEWTDETWNPVTGCDRVSAGCEHCYAETIAHRFAGTAAFPDGFAVTLRPDRLAQPLLWRKPRRVFVNSMSDLFHHDIPDEYIARVFAVMAATPWHTYQVLTKRHGRMRALLVDPGFRSLVYDALAELRDRAPVVFSHAAQSRQLAWPARNTGWPLPNVWMGVSAESQKWADIRVPALLNTPVAVRFVSAEPLLGPVDLSPWLQCRHGPGEGAHAVSYTGNVCDHCHAVVRFDTNRITTVRPGDLLDWVIVGGESGLKARPMHPDWACNLRDQCEVAGVPFFFKQWGEFAPEDANAWVDSNGSPRGPRTLLDAHGRSWNGFERLAPPHAVGMRRVGKKRSGRRLDGRTWDQYPTTRNGDRHAGIA